MRSDLRPLRARAAYPRAACAAILVLSLAPIRAVAQDGFLIPNGLINVDGGVFSLVISPDNLHAYVAIRFPGAIAVYERNLTTGVFSLVETETGFANETVFSIAISPDGAHLYTTDRNLPGGVSAFSRNPGTGALTFVETESDGMNGVDGLHGAIHVQVAPDGAHVYVSGYLDRSIVVFERNALTGELNFIQNLTIGVAGTPNDFFPSDLAIAPDGEHLYTHSSFDAAAVHVFDRNIGTGMLTFIEAEPNGGSSTVGGFDGKSACIISPDGANVYVTLSSMQEGPLSPHHDIVVFSRDAMTGELTRIQTLSDGLNATGILHVTGLAISPDGASVYAAAPETNLTSNPPNEPSAVTYFDRNPLTGIVTFRQVELIQSTSPDNHPFQAVGFAIAPDGASLYVAALGNESELAHFYLGPEPQLPLLSPALATVGLGMAALAALLVLYRYRPRVTRSPIQP